MLWYRFWVENRWRLAFSVTMYALQFIMLAKSPRNTSAPLDAKSIMAGFGYVWFLTALFSAGCGIKTQSASMSLSRGLSTSTYFTLTLPVSRFYLFATRTLYGVLQMAMVLISAVVIVWVAFPTVHQAATLTDALLCGVTFFVCCLSAYFVSALLSIYLDPQWQIYGSALALIAVWWICRTWNSIWNIFHVFGEFSPMITHSVPWQPLLLSLWIATLLFVLTGKLIETREF